MGTAPTMATLDFAIAKPALCHCTSFVPRFSRTLRKSSSNGLKSQRRPVQRIQAKSEAEDKLRDVIQKGNGILDTVVDFVPESVPRPTAKILAGILGLAVTWWLVQKILSTVVFFAILGIGGFLFLQSQSSGNFSDRDDDDDDDAMSRARKIMDKYK